jgi:hypothetical protein
MIFIQQYLNSLFSTYDWVYFLIGILCIVMKFIPTKYKGESQNVLYSLNTIIAWFYLLTLTYYLIELFIAWYGQNSYELWAFFEIENIEMNAIFYIRLFLPLLIGLLFFIRRLRKNILLTFIFILLVFYEKILILITSVYRDYLPSAWVQSNNFSYFGKAIELITIFVLLILTYIIANKKGKLPYPSLFLK